MDSGFGDDIGVEAVAEVDRVDIVTVANMLERICGGGRQEQGISHHSKSLYMMVKKTWRKRLTALMRTASRYSHASPDMVNDVF